MIHNDDWHCGCCSLKGGCRLGAIWSMVEAVGGIALLVASGLLGHGNPSAIAATCYFVIVFCFAWVLLAGIFREATGILWTWVAIYVIFLLIRIVLLGFLVTSYVEYDYDKPVSFEVAYLSDGTALSQNPDMVDSVMERLIGVMAVLGVSILISAWILIGVVYLAVGIRRNMWRKSPVHVEYASYR